MRQIVKISYPGGLVSFLQILLRYCRVVRKGMPSSHRASTRRRSSLVHKKGNDHDRQHKELIWLEAGHGLGGANAGQFVDVMVNKLLKQTYE